MERKFIVYTKQSQSKRKSSKVQKHNNDSPSSSQSPTFSSVIEPLIAAQATTKLLTAPDPKQEEETQPEEHGSKSIWKNLSNLFKSSQESEVDRGRRKSSLGSRIKQSSIRKFGALFGHQKTDDVETENTANTLIKKGHHRSKKTNRESQNGLAMAFRLPSGSTTDNAEITVEMQALNKSHRERSHHKHLRGAHPIGLSCSEDTASKTMFIGEVQVPYDIHISQLATIPLYLVDSKEQIMINPGEEFRPTKVVNKMKSEEGKDELVDNVRIIVRFDKRTASKNHESRKSSRKPSLDKSHHHKKTSTVSEPSDKVLKCIFLSSSDVKAARSASQTNKKIPVAGPSKHNDRGVGADEETPKILAELQYKIQTRHSEKQKSQEEPVKLDKTTSLGSSINRPLLQETSTQYSYAALNGTKGVDIQSSLFQEPQCSYAALNGTKGVDIQSSLFQEPQYSYAALNGTKGVDIQSSLFQEPQPTIKNYSSEIEIPDKKIYRISKKGSYISSVSFTSGETVWPISSDTTTTRSSGTVLSTVSDFVRDQHRSMAVPANSPKSYVDPIIYKDYYGQYYLPPDFKVDPDAKEDHLDDNTSTEVFGTYGSYIENNSIPRISRNTQTSGPDEERNASLQVNNFQINRSHPKSIITRSMTKIDLANEHVHFMYPEDDGHSRPIQLQPTAVVEYAKHPLIHMEDIDITLKLLQNARNKLIAYLNKGTRKKYYVNYVQKMSENDEQDLCGLLEPVKSNTTEIESINSERFSRWSNSLSPRASSDIQRDRRRHIPMQPEILCNGEDNDLINDRRSRNLPYVFDYRNNENIFDNEANVRQDPKTNFSIPATVSSSDTSATNQLSSIIIQAHPINIFDETNPFCPGQPKPSKNEDSVTSENNAALDNDAMNKRDKNNSVLPANGDIIKVEEATPSTSKDEKSSNPVKLYPETPIDPWIQHMTDWQKTSVFLNQAHSQDDRVETLSLDGNNTTIFSDILSSAIDNLRVEISTIQSIYENRGNAMIGNSDDSSKYSLDSLSQSTINDSNTDFTKVDLQNAPTHKRVLDCLDKTIDCFQELETNTFKKNINQLSTSMNNSPEIAVNENKILPQCLENTAQCPLDSANDLIPKTNLTINLSDSSPKRNDAIFSNTDMQQKYSFTNELSLSNGTLGEVENKSTCSNVDNAVSLLVENNKENIVEESDQINANIVQSVSATNLQNITENRSKTANEILAKKQNKDVDGILDCANPIKYKKSSEPGPNESKNNLIKKSVQNIIKDCVRAISSIKCSGSIIGVDNKKEDKSMSTSQSEMNTPVSEKSFKSIGTFSIHKVEPTQSDENKNAYLLIEKDIQKLVQELIQQSQGIKNIAIENGIIEEVEPPFSSDIITSFSEEREIFKNENEATSDKSLTDDDKHNSNEETDISSEQIINDKTVDNGGETGIDDNKNGENLTIYEKQHQKTATNCADKTSCDQESMVNGEKNSTSEKTAVDNKKNTSCNPESMLKEKTHINSVETAMDNKTIKAYHKESIIKNKNPDKSENTTIDENENICSGEESMINQVRHSNKKEAVMNSSGTKYSHEESIVDKKKQVTNSNYHQDVNYILEILLDRVNFEVDTNPWNAGDFPCANNNYCNVIKHKEEFHTKYAYIHKTVGDVKGACTVSPITYSFSNNDLLPKFNVKQSVKYKYDKFFKHVRFKDMMWFTGQNNDFPNISCRSLETEDESNETVQFRNKLFVNLLDFSEESIRTLPKITSYRTKIKNFINTEAKSDLFCKNVTNLKSFKISDDLATFFSRDVSWGCCRSENYLTDNDTNMETDNETKPETNGKEIENETPSDKVEIDVKPSSFATNNFLLKSAKNFQFFPRLQDAYTGTIETGNGTKPEPNGKEIENETPSDEVESDVKPPSFATNNLLLNSAKNFQLSRLQDANAGTNLPSTSRYVFSVTNVTDEEQVCAETDLTKKWLSSTTETDEALQQPPILGLVSKASFRTTASRVYESSSSDETIASVSTVRRRKKLRKDQEEIIDLLPTRSAPSYSIADGLVRLPYLLINSDLGINSNNSYISLKPTVSFENILKQKNESPQAVNIASSDKFLNKCADESAISLGGRFGASESDYEGDQDEEHGKEEVHIKLDLTLPQSKKKSVQAINSPSEIDAIEKNLLQNDALERRNPLVIKNSTISSKDNQTSSYTSISQSSKTFSDDVVINVIEGDVTPA